VDGQQQGASPVVVAGREVAVRVDAPPNQPLMRAVKVGQETLQVEHFVLEPPPRAETVQRDGRTARVKFAVQPWAQVTCDGKLLGETPFDAVELGVGSHECRFFNPELEKAHTLDIKVKAIDLNVVKVQLK
jgi:hypothetical protein